MMVLWFRKNHIHQSVICKSLWSTCKMGLAGGPIDLSLRRDGSRNQSVIANHRRLVTPSRRWMRITFTIFFLILLSISATTKNNYFFTLLLLFSISSRACLSYLVSSSSSFSSSSFSSSSFSSSSWLKKKKKTKKKGREKTGREKTGREKTGFGFFASIIIS